MFRVVGFRLLGFRVQGFRVQGLVCRIDPQGVKGFFRVSELQTCKI